MKSRKKNLILKKYFKISFLFKKCVVCDNDLEIDPIEILNSLCPAQKNAKESLIQLIESFQELPRVLCRPGIACCTCFNSLFKENKEDLQR